MVQFTLYFLGLEISMRDRKVAKEKLQGKYSERFKDELLCLDQNDYKNYLAQIRTRDGRTVTSCIKKFFSIFNLRNGTLRSGSRPDAGLRQRKTSLGLGSLRICITGTAKEHKKRNSASPRLEMAMLQSFFLVVQAEMTGKIQC